MVTKVIKSVQLKQQRAAASQKAACRNQEVVPEASRRVVWQKKIPMQYTYVGSVLGEEGQKSIVESCQLVLQQALMHTGYHFVRIYISHCFFKKHFVSARKCF